MAAAQAKKHLVADALTAARRDRKLSLREASRRASAMGIPLSHSRLLRMESGALRPSADELMCLASLYDLPEDDVLDLVDAERVGAVVPDTGTLEELVRRAEEHFRQGDIPQAIGHALALRRMSAFGAEQRAWLQRAQIGFAWRAKNLRWLRLSRRLLDEVLRAPESPDLAGHALLVASTLWWEAGSLLVAEAMLEKAETLLPRDDFSRATVFHQRAKLLKEGGKHVEAMRDLKSARRLYRRAGDIENTLRLRHLEIGILEGMGRLDDALAAAGQVVERAGVEGHRRQEAGGRMEFGRLLVIAGRGADGTREIRRAAAMAALLEDPELEFDAQYRLWKACQATGEHSAAQLALQSAAHLLTRIERGDDMADEVRAAAADSGRNKGAHLSRSAGAAGGERPWS